MLTMANIRRRRRIGASQTPSSVWLAGREGVAFIPDGDWLTIIDNGTPANNYDGKAADHPLRNSYAGRAFGLPVGTAVPEPVGGHTFFLDATEVSTGTQTFAISQSATNYSDLRWPNGQLISVNGGVTQGFLTYTTTVGVRATVAARYAANDFAVSKDGAVPSKDTSGTYGGASYAELTFYCGVTGTNADTSTTVHAFLYLPTPLADTPLRALTSP